MAALVCDLCGGKLIMGASGIATCESCGIEHSADRMKEKVQEIKGTVRVDNSHMVENYLEIARTAKDAGNNAEAESYCNKALEVEPTNYKAWMLKGEAVAWQSSVQKSRVDEGVTAFAKGINNAPKEAKEEVIEEAKEQINSLFWAMISLRVDRFAKWPDEEESDGIVSALISMYNTLASFIEQTDVPMDFYKDFRARVADQICQSVVKACKNVIWPDYNGNSDNRAGRYEWQTFIKRLDYCIPLVHHAILFCGEDDEDNIQRYENIIFMEKAAIDSCSWDYDFTDGGKNWYKDFMLSDNAKNMRRQRINRHETKIKEIKASVAARQAAEKAEKERIACEEAQKRFDSYWAEHADEKASLEAEQKELNAQIVALNASLNDQVAALNKEIAVIPEKLELDNIEERIKKLTEEKSSLGLFKGKEKKEIQEQIDRANIEKKGVQDRMDAVKKELESKILNVKAEIQKKVSPLQNRIDIISDELTKKR